MLIDKIKKKQSNFLFYGLTPPKLDTQEERILSIANKQIERLDGIDLDALILYDIQDESSRTNEPRPFPYLQTLAPDVYSDQYLQGLKLPKIIYKSIGKFTAESYNTWLSERTNTQDCYVFVGAPSKEQKISLTLQDAYQININTHSHLTYGGVTIPERHEAKGDEHKRVFDKMNKGCEFFISQCVYNVDNSKHLLSDYYYYAKENNLEMVPIIFTLTPCGSLKTLEFMNWLGIDIPGWLKNELKYSNNILAKSITICEDIAKELYDFCTQKNIPVGFNIESVAIRKDEIEASIELLKTIKTMMDK